MSKKAHPALWQHQKTRKPGAQPPASLTPYPAGSAKTWRGMKREVR